MTGVARAGFRQTFDCLWCGRTWTTRTEHDLEGWAALCPDCLGRAQENAFLRFRLKSAIRERAAASHDGEPSEADPPRAESAEDSDAELKAYYAARATEYDDWYLRRGRYSRGPVRDLAWHAELDEVTRWVDGLPLSGEIVELAAGTGWWSPLLAQKGELSIYDAVPEPLELARERLLAHRLRAHIHVRDAWEPPDRKVDAVFCGFWLSHVRREGLDEFLGIVRSWLKPGGIFAFVDSLPDPESGAVDHAPVGADGMSIRRLADGREFRIPKIHYEPDELRDALIGAGFGQASVTRTARFFLMGMAQ